MARRARFLAAVLEPFAPPRPGSALGVRLSADSPRARTIAALAEAGGADYLSFALGDSSTYLGSTGIVPPPPVEEAAIAQADRSSRPAADRDLAGGRRRDEAERLLADGRAEAVGMTRALIADPELPAQGS